MGESASKILYLSYDGLIDPLGQSQIMPYLVGLSKEGFDITIVSFEKPERFSSHQTQIKAQLGNAIKWVPLMYHKRPPVLSTIFDVLTLWLTAKRLHRESKFQIVHCRSYITSLIGLEMKRRMGVKFVFDMRGFWADERVEGGLWNLKNPVYRLVYNFFKNKEQQFLTEANHIVSLTENAKNEIESWKLKTAPISVIPTCVDLDLFDPKKIKEADTKALRQKLGFAESDFVLLYLGSWGTWYLTNEMLSFFSELKKHKPDAKFLIVTPDQVEVPARHNDDVVVTRAQRKEVPLFISISDAAIFFIKPSFSKKASSATKMGEILAMGKPVVTNRGWGDIELHFTDHPTVCFIDPLKPDITAIESTLQSSVGEDQDALRRFSLGSGILSYYSIYGALS